VHCSTYVRLICRICWTSCHSATETLADFRCKIVEKYSEHQVFFKNFFYLKKTKSAPVYAVHIIWYFCYHYQSIFFPHLSVGCLEYVNIILHFSFIQNPWNECILWDHVHLPLLACVLQISMKSDIWETALQVFSELYFDPYQSTTLHQFTIL